MYQALYRKYRPIDFNSVVGQDSIIKTLKNSIINHNFSHAYMFFGPRGTGKTTISKIFARNINCSSPIDGIACHKCDSCKASFSKNCVDIIEIDAASNNGVDEIRDLKNKITLVPSELKYKVYIIDEVHMLSIGAFNALLKTLEEPPEHAIFILATTDPQKVPETIISRCQCFSFKRISDNVIKNRLKYVCNEENILIEDDVLNNIAMLADGGLRDALGSLDKLTSYTKDRITIDDFTEVNGIVSDSDICLLIKDILSGNIQNVLKNINDFNSNGKNLIQIMVQLLNYSRNLLVDYYISNKNIDFSLDHLQELANIINEKMFDIKKSGNTKIYIELLLLKFINTNIFNKNSLKNEIVEDNNISDNVSKKNDISDESLKIKEKEVENNITTDMNFENNDNSDKYFIEEEKSGNTIPKILNIDEIMKIRVNNTMALANKGLLKLELANFEKLREYTFDQEIGYLVCSLLDAKLRTVSPENIIISFEFDSNVKQNLLNIEMITEVYNKITNSNKNIAIISDEEWDKVKNDYITNLKNNIKYDVLPEPELIFEELANNDIMVSSAAVELFGDIVEID
ncbi:MAG: DNA polymerase III subunit gamma/tau [Bacilli bacterium]|nr:DNA polymerase III subunit gamma/tau [Bacilli bacterium]